MIRIVRNSEDAKKLAESVLGPTARIYEDQLSGEKVLGMIRLSPETSAPVPEGTAPHGIAQLRGKGKTWTDVFLRIGVKVIGPDSSVLYQGRPRLVREVTEGLLHLAGVPSTDPHDARESGSVVCDVADVQLCDSAGMPI